MERFLDVEAVVSAAQALFDADEHFDIVMEHREVMEAQMLAAEEDLEEAREVRRAAAEHLTDILLEMRGSQQEEHPKPGVEFEADGEPEREGQNAMAFEPEVEAHEYEYMPVEFHEEV